MDAWHRLIVVAFECVVDASLGAVILVLLLMLARGAGTRWLTPQWRLWCGGLVLFRLFWPVSIESPASIWNLARFVAVRPEWTEELNSHAAETRSFTPHESETTNTLTESSPISASNPIERGVAQSDQVGAGEPADRLEASPPVETSGEYLAPVATGFARDVPPISPATESDPTGISKPVGSTPPPGTKMAGSRSPFTVPGVAGTVRTAVMIAAAVWLLGSLWMFGASVLGHVRFSRRVRRHGRPASEQARQSLDQCRAILGVRRRVQVVELDDIGSPVVFGFFRPRIVLPAGSARTLSPSALRHVFLHEMAHIRCADVLVNWLIIAARAVHWFNPIARLALRQLIADRELVRDQIALRTLGDEPDHRRAYGRTLLELAESLSRPRLSPGLAPLIHSEKEIHRRITMITSPTPTRLRWPWHCLFGAALLGIAALTFTVATGQNKPAPAPAPQPPAALPSPSADPPPAPVSPVLPDFPRPVEPPAVSAAPPTGIAPPVPTIHPVGPPDSAERPALPPGLCPRFRCLRRPQERQRVRRHGPRRFGASPVTRCRSSSVSIW